jgi:hypothetical protein
MKMTINTYDEIQLEGVYNTIIFVTNAKEELALTIRDNGFEFYYEGVLYFAQKGEITKIYE